MPSTLLRNLPTYDAPILGRTREIDEVASLLSQLPVVTIAGAGGIGKTRLAVQVAEGFIETMRDGVCFVDLAPLAGNSPVATTVANTIGIDLNGNLDSYATLAARLASHNMLILLDNCEHVVTQAAELVAAIVTTCPQMRVLATSREPLASAHEAVYRLDTLDERASVAVFVERLEVDERRPALTGEDVIAIAEICRHLDGIPLAIELAAARARQMPLAELLARLDERFRLLIRGADATVARHATLRALFDWSYDLLSEEERAVFRRLGTFSGGFTREAAIRVVSEDERIEPRAALDRITALVEKSMVSFSRERRRYSMLETIREYARDRLRRTTDEERARHAHAAFFDDVTAEATTTFATDAEDAWLARYEPDLDNFRAALDWTATAEPGVAARMMANLKEFWNYVNFAAEGLQRAKTVLQAVANLGDDRATLCAELAAGYLSGRAQDYRSSLESADRALVLAERLGDSGAIAAARRIAGSALLVLGDTQRATAELRVALEYFRAGAEPVRALHAANEYGWALLHSDPAKGRALMLDALASAQALDWPRAAIHITIRLAEAEFHTGDTAAAIERARGAVETCRLRHSSERLAHALCNLCSYLSVAGQYAAVRSAGREAVGIAQAHDLPALVEYVLQSCSICIAERGDPATAARLLGHVNQFMADLGYERERTETMVHQRLLETLRAHLDDAALQSELSAGGRLSREAAIALAFG